MSWKDKIAEIVDQIEAAYVENHKPSVDQLVELYKLGEETEYVQNQSRND
ncbi:MAG: hypothetical protein ACLP4V_22310 [Methylocella sp.]